MLLRFVLPFISSFILARYINCEHRFLGISYRGGMHLTFQQEQCCLVSAAQYDAKAVWQELKQ